MCILNSSAALVCAFWTGHLLWYVHSEQVSCFGMCILDRSGALVCVFWTCQLLWYVHSGQVICFGMCILDRSAALVCAFWTGQLLWYVHFGQVSCFGMCILNRSAAWYVHSGQVSCFGMCILDRSAALVCAFCIVCRIHLFEMLRTRSVVYPLVKKCGYKTIHNFIMRYETVVLYWYNGHDYTEMWYFSL